eukprot:scaffold9194_cov65-Phaeocystis_antarctica.AAC.3
MSKSTTTPHRAASRTRSRPPPPGPAVCRVCRKGPQLGYQRRDHNNKCVSRPSTTSVSSDTRGQQSVGAATAVCLAARPAGSRHRAAHHSGYCKGRANGLWGSAGKKLMARPHLARAICIKSSHLHQVEPSASSRAICIKSSHLHQVEPSVATSRANFQISCAWSAKRCTFIIQVTLCVCFCDISAALIMFFILTLFLLVLRRLTSELRCPDPSRGLAGLLPFTSRQFTCRHLLPSSCTAH